jgi:D-alanyl-D-alanine carboxypeptidase
MAGDPSSCRHALQDRLESKTMTSAVIMLLAQGGKIGFHDPVSKYVPGVPNGDHIIIVELLKMRNGLYNYTDALELSASLDHGPTKVWTPAEVLAIAFKHPPSKNLAVLAGS